MCVCLRINDIRIVSHIFNYYFIFNITDVNLFRGELIRSSSPNIVILGVPIGDLEFCSNHISNKCASAKLLLRKLEEVGAQDAQVALVLLRLCGSFCKLAHLARATPPSLSIKALELFDIDVRHCFSQCTAVDPSDVRAIDNFYSLGGHNTSLCHCGLNSV